MNVIFLFCNIQTFYSHVTFCNDLGVFCIYNYYTNILFTASKPRKRKFVPKVQKDSTTSLATDLLKKKLELVQLQIDILKKEHEQKERRLEEKHAAEMRILNEELVLKQKLKNM